MNTRPLEGIRVLDFSWVWSGPLVTSMLAEFGAEVIKVEHGKRLDNSRLRGRPMRDGKPVDGPSIETGPYYHQTNHDKLSITINLKMPQARALLDDLVGISDVVVENLSPGALERAGMGYPRVSRINPRLVYLSMSAAGQSGPLSALRAYAPIMSSYCGFETCIGYAGQAPIGMMNFGYGDPNAAIHGLLPLLAALLERDMTGRGQHIDMSQLEALLSVLGEPIIDCTMNQRDVVTQGNRHPRMAPHGIYPAAGVDRWVSIAVADDAQWQALAQHMRLPPSRCDAWRTTAGRLAQRDEIDRELALWTVGQEPEKLVATLRVLGIACSPVQDVAAQQQDPHFAARAMRAEVAHPITGPETLYQTPWRVETQKPQVRASAPVLGQHNDYVFGELLGMPAQRIEQLTAEGVLC